MAASARPERLQPDARRAEGKLKPKAKGKGKCPVSSQAVDTIHLYLAGINHSSLIATPTVAASAYTEEFIAAHQVHQFVL